jgi:galactokinase
MNIQQVKEQFRSRFGREPQHVVRAPGRVNLIGEHTDYNDGFVLPIAIERQVTAAVGARPDRMLRFASLQQQRDSQVSLDELLAPGEPAWANYPKGVAAGLKEAGVELVGADVLFDSTVPVGAGLSSSAALEVAAAKALLAAAGSTDAVTGRELALLCQKAEHTFAGAPCGIMDQSISVLGQRGHALLLDARDGSTRQIPFDRPDAVLLVCDTKVQHAISDGGYGARRKQCEDAAAKLNVSALRDAKLEDAIAAHKDGTLSDVEMMRARHVITEIDRTLRAVDALEAGDYAAFGLLMYGSHESLRDDFEVSCEELDAIVGIARAQAGVFGARMTGGGFGGCAIILAKAEAAEAIADAVARDFAKRFGHACPIFATRAEQGAEVVE